MRIMFVMINMICVSCYIVILDTLNPFLMVRWRWRVLNLRSSYDKTTPQQQKFYVKDCKSENRIFLKTLLEYYSVMGILLLSHHNILIEVIKIDTFNPFSPSVLYKGRQLLLPSFYTESHYF